MTIIVGKHSLTLPWPVAASLCLFLIVTTYKGVTFTDGVLTTLSEIKHDLAIVKLRDSVYKNQTENNTRDIGAIKPYLNTMYKRVTALEEVLPANIRTRYYNEIRTKDGIEFRPLP